MYKAFTLVEIIVVTAMITSIGFFVIPVSLSAVSASRADGVATQISSLIFKQQQDAYSGYLNSEFGIQINNGSITTYNGDSFDIGTNKRTLTFPTVSLGTSLADSSNVIHFNKGELRPSTNGTINVTSSGKTTEIVINKEGLVYVNK